jgi:hypothetical protein
MNMLVMPMASGDLATHANRIFGESCRLGILAAAAMISCEEGKLT